MARVPRQPLATPRDRQILAALDQAPLTALQLLKLSRTFALPFTNERRVRERLHTLAESGRVHRWQYATAGRGALNYYTLSRLGHALLHGPEAEPLTKRAFSPVRIGFQHHTISLADFIVHTQVGAHEGGVGVAHFCRENTLRLDIGAEALYPDCSFQLVPREAPPLAFFVELDNATERIRSSKDLDSWERKIRLYEAYQELCGQRFRVLLVGTRSSERLTRILDAARVLAKNPQRRTFYGIALPDWLAAPQPLSEPCFRDHFSRAVSLLPAVPSMTPLPAVPAMTLAEPALAC